MQPSEGPIGIGTQTTVSLEDPQAYLKRLDRLVRFLLGGRYDSPAQLWKLEIDLLCLQQDLQREITVLKLTDRDAEAHERLRQMRHLRAEARRFGDAIAWVYLGLERQIIIPLAENDPVRIPADDHGTRGTLAFAQGMAAEGWGFPLLHDITDCLRIGDITFIRRDQEPLTVEVKTRLRSEQMEHDSATLAYDIAALSARPMPELRTRTDLAQGNLGLAPQTPSPAVESRRASRQFDRLIKVKARQDASPDQLIEIKGEPPLISKTVDTSDVSGWSVLRRVARRARRTGYAAESVDDAFVFVALYDADGLHADRLTALLDQLTPDIAKSGLFPPQLERWNALWVNSIPEEPRRTACRFLPYFLYSLPKTTIIDLLHGRMLLLHLSNPAQIASAMQRRGFTVHPKRGHDYRTGFDVRIEFQLTDGQRFRLDLGALDMPIREMIMEFHSVEFIVRVVEGMRDAGIDTARVRSKQAAS